MATRKEDKSRINSGSKKARQKARVTAEQKNPTVKIPARSGRVSQAMTLSSRDRNVFVAALLKAPAPGARLRKAAQRYKKQVGK
jgi:hypothetical protein